MIPDPLGRLLQVEVLMAGCCLLIALGLGYAAWGAGDCAPLSASRLAVAALGFLGASLAMGWQAWQTQQMRRRWLKTVEAFRALNAERARHGRVDQEEGWVP